MAKVTAPFEIEGTIDEVKNLANFAKKLSELCV